MSEPIMRCGHAANATRNHKDGTKTRCCAICMCDEIVEGIDLTGRSSKCSYCGTVTASSDALPFFEYRPGHTVDLHYCGCRGWD